MEFTATVAFLTVVRLVQDYRGANGASIPHMVTEGRYASAARPRRATLCYHVSLEGGFKTNAPRYNSPPARTHRPPRPCGTGALASESRGAAQECSPRC